MNRRDGLQGDFQHARREHAEIEDRDRERASAKIAVDDKAVTCAATAVFRMYIMTMTRR